MDKRIMVVLLCAMLAFMPVMALTVQKVDCDGFWLYKHSENSFSGQFARFWPWWHIQGRC